MATFLYLDLVQQSGIKPKIYTILSIEHQIKQCTTTPLYSELHAMLYPTESLTQHDVTIAAPWKSRNLNSPAQENGAQ